MGALFNIGGGWLTILLCVLGVIALALLILTLLVILGIIITAIVIICVVVRKVKKTAKAIVKAEEEIINELIGEAENTNNDVEGTYYTVE